MAKKAANKSSKTMSEKGMKKTKGGLIGLLLPAVQKCPSDPSITGNTITGNTLNGDNKLNGGTLTNNTWSG